MRSEISLKKFCFSFLTSISCIVLSACGGQQEKNVVSPSDALAAPAPANSVLSLTLPNNRSNYTIVQSNNDTIVTDMVGNEGSKTISNANKLIFKDMSVNLNLAALYKKITEAQLQSLIELYIAFFNRVPDADGLEYWITQLINGASKDQIADSFYNAGILYPNLTGYSATMSAADFVRIVYKNVLGRTGATAPTDTEVNYWADTITKGLVSKAQVVNVMITAARTFVDDPVYAWVPQLLNNKLAVGRYASIEQGISYLSASDNITLSMAIIADVSASDTSLAMSRIGIKDSNFSLIPRSPDAPTDLKATAANGSATISFLAPARDGGSAILNYTATCTANGSSVKATASTSPINVTGLVNGTTYACNIKATNKIGDSTFSNSVTVTPVTVSQGFKLSSSAGVEGASMSADYTCDGTGSTVPLTWINPPVGTKEFALLMTTIPGDGTTKWNWIVYNIPANIASLSKDSFGVGNLGVGSDGPMAMYQPPCSQGPGAKVYTFTLYALSASPSIPSGTTVTGQVLTNAIAGITLGSANLNLNYTRTNTGSSAACLNVRNSVQASNTGYSIVSCDANYAYVSSFGIANHTMMNGITGTNLQVPSKQKFNGAYGWKIPLNPAIANTTTTANDGPIGIAINGVPIFNPCKQGGCQNGDTKVLGELDVCNGHAGRADDYHYHAAPTCVMAGKPSNYWDTHPVGWALDGFAIFGYNNADGKVAPRDSVCGGNTDPTSNAPSAYAYHVTDASPYVLACFRGSPSPDLANQASKYSPMRQPPVTPFTVSGMTLTTDSSDGYQVLQFSTAKSFTTTETGSDSYSNQAGTYKIRYKEATGAELATLLAQTKNAGKTMCWNFQFLNASGTTTQPNISYCR